MNDLDLNLSALPDLSVSRIAALPAERLQQLDVALAELANQVKQARERLSAGLQQRFGEKAHAALLASGRDFGVAHISSDGLRVTYELPKRASWNQTQLGAIAERIVAAGERVQDFMDVELSVPEARFNNWPPALKEQFAGARTVKPGKPTFRLALIDAQDPQS